MNEWVLIIPIVLIATMIGAWIINRTTPQEVRHTCCRRCGIEMPMGTKHTICLDCRIRTKRGY